MAFRVGSCLLVLFLVSAMMQISVVEGTCYETWSRCSRWSRWGTGRLWKSCNDRCKELGYTGGSCQRCPSTCWMSDKAWQCRCYGMGFC
ncbi:hydramacin-1-like [Orbicella faveolata]|uniref:hydramacin-1-like n=1 Tax=Orbicella faveolata TaxID=48498 RepID=UPI0009E32CC7|nr:hydramacin-1-like [Orbicella faveolata]